MSVLKLDHYNLRVPQEFLEQVLAFYKDVMGLEPGERPPFESRGYWLYASKDPLVHIVVTQSNCQNSADEFDTGRLSHIAFFCTCIDAAELALQNRAIKYRRATIPGGGSVQLLFRDPVGVGVELVFPA